MKIKTKNSVAPITAQIIIEAPSAHGVKTVNFETINETNPATLNCKNPKIALAVPENLACRFIAKSVVVGMIKPFVAIVKNSAISKPTSPLVFPKNHAKLAQIIIITSPNFSSDIGANFLSSFAFTIEVIINPSEFSPKMSPKICSCIPKCPTKIGFATVIYANIDENENAIVSAKPTKILSPKTAL